MRDRDAVAIRTLQRRCADLEVRLIAAEAVVTAVLISEEGFCRRCKPYEGCHTSTCESVTSAIDEYKERTNEHRQH